MKLLFVMKDVNNYPPLGIMQLSAIAKQNGHTTALGLLDKEELSEKIGEFDLLCYGGCTGEHRYYAEFNRKVKTKSKILSVVGGPHATFFPEHLIKGKFDFLIRGEAEYDFEQLLNGNASKGVIFSKKLVKDLDTLPFPDRELFKGTTSNQGFIFSRGCPYSCSYCYNNNIKQLYGGEQFVRYNSADYCIDQLLQVKQQFNPKSIKIFDDVITYRVNQRFEDFCVKYREKIKIPFWALSRFDLLTPEMLDLLRYAGCRCLQVSIESFDEDMRCQVLNRKMNQEVIIKGIELCKKYNIKLITNVMLGLPTSTVKTDIQAVSDLSKLNLDYVDFPIFQPYPKTKLGDDCIRNGCFNGDCDRIGTTYFSGSIIFPKQSRVLKNLSMLGTVVVKYPKLAKFLPVLIKLPLHRLYSVGNYLVKYCFYKKALYNYRHSLLDSIKIIWKGLRLQ